MTQTQYSQELAPGLSANSADGQPLAFPLKHTAVQAKIAGNLSRVEVIQTFENPFTIPLEAVYRFPLPDEAAVDDLEIRIGDRTIKGSIKKRQEAQQIYEQAKQAGRTAGLLEQERDNIFTQSLANILPGERIAVTIRYTDSLKFEAGNYEFVFPMVVGPRYIPGITIADETIGGGTATTPLSLNQDTDLVPDASRLNAPLLPAGTRSGHDIGVSIEIMAGVPIQQISSPSHAIQVDHDEQLVRVKLCDGDTIPNKDLILRYQIAGNQTQTTVLAQVDQRGGHFATYLIPAIHYRSDELVPKDVVFLIDTSGSQSGDPLIKCQELMRRFITGLNPNDTFSIIDFSNTTRQLAPVPLANTRENRAQAIRYIDQLTANGGTDMRRGIQAVLNFPLPQLGRLRSIVLLTDGYIGNENQILGEVQHSLQPGNRLYSFGVGSSVNRFLLNRIAEIGRGIARIIRADEPTEEVAEKFFRQINNPVLTNIQLRWEGAGEAPLIYPSSPSDLFAEQPLVLFGRKGDGLPGRLHITGMTAGGDRYQQTFDLHFAAGNPAIAQLWGRARIKDLTNQMISGDTKAGVEAVTATALTYQLLSQYTAFVAVSDEVRANPAQQSVSVQVPVEMPEGVSHSGVFGSMGATSPPNVRRRQFAAPAPMAPVMADFAQPPGEMFQEESRSAESSSFSFHAIFPTDIDFTEVDEFDITLLSPGAMDLPDQVQGLPRNEPKSVQPIAPLPSDRIQVVSAIGLTQEAIDLLTQHLQQVKLPSGISGTIVFEFHISTERILGLIRKHRLSQLVLDEQASTVQEITVIEELRRSLLTWRPPSISTSSVRLVLHIKS